MKFKLVEKFNTRSMVQEYMYDAIDELNNASLEEYIQWFEDNLTAYPEDLEQAVTDAYIEACDYGMIKGVEKTRLTSELKEYIESHKNIIDDTDELMKQCPSHLQHELEIVLSKLDESLNEQFLTEVQSTEQRNANKRYKNDINKIDTTINPADYVVHHLDKTNKIQLSNGETIQVTDKSNCVLLPKINRDSNVVHQAVHGALVCGGLDDYIRALKNCEVIKQNEDNTISRISLEEFINNSIKN